MAAWQRMLSCRGKVELVQLTGKGHGGGRTRGLFAQALGTIADAAALWAFAAILHELPIAVVCHLTKSTHGGGALVRAMFAGCVAAVAEQHQALALTLAASRGELIDTNRLECCVLDDVQGVIQLLGILEHIGIGPHNCLLLD